MNKTKIEYETTGDVTGKVKVDGEELMVKSFKFEHDALNAPTATLEVIFPEMMLSASLDSILIKRVNVFEEIKEEVENKGLVDVDDVLKIVAKHLGVSK